MADTKRLNLISTEWSFGRTLQANLMNSDLTRNY